MRDTTTPVEATLIVIVAFGWSIWYSLQAVVNDFPATAFTDQNTLGLIGFELLCGALCLTGLLLRGYAVASLWPRPSLQGVVQGVALYGVAVAACWIVVLPFSWGGDQPIDDIMRQSQVSMPVVFMFAVVNGTYEEIFLLGFLLRGLRGHGLFMAMGISLLVRVLYHLYQGPIGALSILVFGLVLGLYYVKTNKLFPVVAAHILGDIVPFLGT